ncbi:MAG: HdeD family acid-resistance protein [Planctomycetes bacterium]|nr:HdeD family acid-resistance protein [Planctomycetota bacterium]
MSTTLDRTPAAELRHDLMALQGNWLWFALLGAGMIVLGFVALGALVTASLATAVAIGILLLVGGAVETVGAIGSRGWSGFFGHLLSGVLSLVVGVLFLRAPIGALLVLTLLLACLLLVGGLFRIIAALNYRFAGWGWTLAVGLIDVALGVMIGMDWPAAALWVIGLFVGISFVFRGVNWISLGVALRTLPRTRPV